MAFSIKQSERIMNFAEGFQKKIELINFANFQVVDCVLMSQLQMQIDFINIEDFNNIAVNQQKDLQNSIDKQIQDDGLSND